MNARSVLQLSQAPAGKPPEEAEEGVFAQLGSLLRALGASRCRRQIGLLAAGIVAVICANAVGQIRLNAWQGAFFDAIEQRHVAAFGDQLLIFAAIVAALLVLVVAQTWLQEMIKVRLREWLTHDLLEQWLVPQRAHHLAFAGEIGVNPDQRIHEDTRHLTELSASLGVGLLQSSLLLVSFVGVLWLLSAEVVFSAGGSSFAIPGYMVWCALGYSLGGSWLAWRIGRPLIRLNTERYAREAELRFALVRVSESAEGIALYGGEADERRMLQATVDGVVTIIRRLAGGLARLTWITSGYGWLAIVVPILVAAPGYFGGDLSFGGLMMVVGAFNQVQQSLRWFVDNFPQIADWRATLLRVATFRDALLAVETLGEDVGRIEVVDHQAGKLVVEDLSVVLTDGCAVLDEAKVEVAPGERISILGEAGSGRDTLLRAMAGLWPWGTGSVHLPPRETMMFMPQRPYLSLGTLRGAVCYPAASGFCDDTAVRAALERVDLGRLVPSLDREERWDKVLSLEEQQRLAFARLLVHAPRWVLLDEAMGALDAEHRRLVLSIFERDLAGAAVISVDRSRANHGFYARALHVARLPGPCLRTRPRPRRWASEVSVVVCSTGAEPVHGRTHPIETVTPTGGDLRGPITVASTWRPPQ
jgi:putative ATP-binding cassette transporter